MSCKIAAISFFFAFACILNAAAFPDNVLHKSFAIQYAYTDSLPNNRDDSVKAHQYMQQLEKWADDNGDQRLKYLFKLREYYYSLNSRPKENAEIENGLPPLIRQIQDIKYPELEAQALQLLSRYYWGDPKTFGKAYELGSGAYNIYSKYSYTDFPPRYDYMYDYGFAYYRFKDYRNAIPIFMEIQNKPAAAAGPEPVSLLNTIGLCYRRSGMYDSAEYYLNKGYRYAIGNNKKAWLYIVGGNLGITYYYEKRYKEAIPLLEDDIAHGRVSDDATNSLAILGNVYMELGDNKKGLAYLQQSYQYITEERKWKHYDLLAGVYPLLAKAYSLNGQYQAAYDFADSALRTQDSALAQRSALILAGVQQKLDIEKQAAETKQRQHELKVQALIWIFLLLSITLLLLVIFFVLRNYYNQKKTNILLTSEKKRSDDLLLNILPTEVADELKNKGSAEAKYFDHVTVMFTDFVNFTKASETMNPQQLINELHACFKAFDEIISKYDIEKIKTIGDAYLAVSGLPVANKHHAENIVMAAIEINDFMRKRHQQLGNSETFEIRIGIHTGSVVAGIVGVIKFAYDIWGDTVNIAARMEQSSEPGKINISQDTFDLVKNKFRCTYRGQIVAKNKGELGMYFVETD